MNRNIRLLIVTSIIFFTVIYLLNKDIKLINYIRISLVFILFLNEIYCAIKKGKLNEGYEYMEEYAKSPINTQDGDF